MVPIVALCKHVFCFISEKSFHLLLTRNMILLCVTFAYTGRCFTLGTVEGYLQLNTVYVTFLLVCIRYNYNICFDFTELDISVVTDISHGITLSPSPSPSQYVSLLLVTYVLCRCFLFKVSS